jgi:hypothetical protein
LQSVRVQTPLKINVFLVEEKALSTRYSFIPPVFSSAFKFSGPIDKIPQPETYYQCEYFNAAIKKLQNILFFRSFSPLPVLIIMKLKVAAFKLLGTV